MKYHKFTDNDIDNYIIIVAVSNSKKRRMVYTNIPYYSKRYLNKRIDIKLYMTFVNEPSFTHEVLTESEYLLELI